MNLTLPHGRLCLLAAVLLALSVVVGARWEERLVVLPVDGVRVYAQEAADGLRGANATQKIIQKGGSWVAEYGFRNFNMDSLTVRFQMPAEDYARVEAEWGYKDSDLAALKAWHEGARKKALADAVAKGHSQRQLNDELARLKKEYEQKRKDYLASKGFRLLDGGVVEVDMAGLVGARAPRLNAIAKNFDDIAQSKRYDPDAELGAVLSMVQTAVMYKVPPNVVDGVHTGGLWPPEETLVKGWGDCDTKTALLAAILKSFPKAHVIGVGLPDHYIMGVQRLPNKGDHFVEYQGVPYVLVEPAGPAWLPPGTLSETSTRLLDVQEAFKIEALF